MQAVLRASDLHASSTALSRPSGPQQYTSVCPGPVRTAPHRGWSGSPAAFSSRAQRVTRSPWRSNSSTKAIDERVLPPYSSRQSAPLASAAPIIGSIGVMPIPPAMN